MTFERDLSRQGLRMQIRRRYSIGVIALVAVFFLPGVLRADTVTYFGDFADSFGAIPIAYSSTVPYAPGAFVPLMHEGVASIPKFDASLGTLTDIEVFVAPTPTSPIFYSIGGTMSLTKADAGLPGYAGSIGLLADVAVTYKEGPGMEVVISESIELAGAATPPAGSMVFSTGVTPVVGDGMLTGTASVFGFADLADFVGPGLVDTLFVDLIVEDSADFVLDNATATAALAFDVSDSDSGIDDAVIGVTYTFTPVAVPEPSSWAFISIGCGWILLRRRRATIQRCVQGKGLGTRDA